VQTHQPATAHLPEPATELNRIIAVINETARLGARLELGLSRELISTRVVDALQDALRGAHLDIAVATAGDLLCDAARANIGALRRELAHHSGYSTRKLAGTAGLHDLALELGYRGTKPPRAADLDDLPGTTSVLLLRRLLDTNEIADSAPAQLRRAGERVKPAGTSLETQMRKHAARVSQVAEIGAAVVTLETRRHTNLVWHQANRLEKSFPDHGAEDMLGWGWQGLRTAIRLYDPSLGFAFSTYACSRIVGSIRDGVRAENPVPKRLTTYARKVAAAEEKLVQELQRTPTLAEIAERIGSELSQIQIMPRLAPAASVEELTGQMGEKGTVPSWSVDHHDPLDDVIAGEQRQRIEAALAALPAEDAVAVRLMVMEQVPAAEARELTGATTRQLRQRTRRGLEQLAQHLADELD